MLDVWLVGWRNMVVWYLRILMVCALLVGWLCLALGFGFVGVETLECWWFCGYSMGFGCVLICVLR